MSLPETFKAYIVPAKGEKPKLTTLPLTKPGKNQVLVKMEFAPINPADVMTTEGKYPVDVPPPHGVGMEGSGVVVAVGEDLTVPHSVGDRVHVVGWGTMAEYFTTTSELCRKVQDGLDMKDAANHYINPITVHYMGYLALKGGHKAAIHTASSSALGRMTIRYFKKKGIRLINIVRREEVIEELMREGADIVLNSTDPDFEKKLQETAAKENATICFEPILGDLSGRILSNMPDNSIMYIYGALASRKLTNFDVEDFLFKGKTVTGLWLKNYVIALSKTGELEKAYKESYDLLPTIFKTPIQTVYPLSQIEEAFEYNSKNSSKGKVMIQSN